MPSHTCARIGRSAPARAALGGDHVGQRWPSSSSITSANADALRRLEDLGDRDDVRMVDEVHGLRLGEQAIAEPGGDAVVCAIFIAARRRMVTCSTSNTRLVVPSPSFRMRRYDPIVRPGASSIA